VASGKSFSVEYHATMESCSDKFQTDIPNVVLARARCGLPCEHGALSTVLSSDLSERLASPSEKRRKN
jgi:hypothetical protein